MGPDVRSFVMGSVCNVSVIYSIDKGRGTPCLNGVIE